MQMVDCSMVLALAALAALTAATPARPKYIECVDNSECGTWECCVLGRGQFSLPRCRPVGEVGEPCRPHTDLSPRPFNTTVSYPDGQRVFMSAVFLHACPCAPGLHCGAAEAVCENPDGGFNDM